ncbi:hypothetical protein EDD11_001659 [Mortierella claussenii]|nr:hypothetical protein EDD11_001659 [Mortierella claussenii]
MPNYVSLTESQRRKIAVFITESQQQAQLQQQQQLQATGSNGDDSVIGSTPLVGSPGGSSGAVQAAPIAGNNSISCKEIVQFCKTRFGLTISLSTASRLRSSATERLATELLNPSAKRHRSVKFPEFEKALVQELKALEQEQLQIQQEQERQNGDSGVVNFGDQQLPPVMMLTSEAAITQVAKGIAERMGIPPVELGLTSGWYHGFKRRHGIKHRQFKSRSGTNGNNGITGTAGLVGPTLGSIGASGAGDGSSSLMETEERSDGPDGDGDEEMEDVQDSTDAGDSKVSGDGSGDAGLNSTSTLLNFSNIVLTPKEPSASSLSRRPEVKKVTAATANDALDVISEYLLQNGQIGATKLPLVKELRKFLLAQTEAENGIANNNSNSGILLSVGVPPLAPSISNSENVSNFEPIITAVDNNVLPVHTPVSLSPSTSAGGPGLASAPENMQSSLNLPANGLATMEEILNSHKQAQQEQAQQEQAKQTQQELDQQREQEENARQQPQQQQQQPSPQ